MAVPGLPVPSGHNNKLSTLSRRKRASQALSISSLKGVVGGVTPTARRRGLLFLAFFVVFLFGRHYGSAPPRPPPFLVPAKTLPKLEYNSNAAATPGQGDVSVRMDRVPDQRIPDIVHYVFGMSQDFGGKPFGFSQFVAANSALETLRPQKVILWYRYLPSGWWFNKIQEYAAKKGIVWENRLAREVTEIFGNPIDHFAHKADIIRLEALKQYGGIYLDSDVFVIKDFKPLYRFDAVMGMEASPDSDRSDMEPSGLCNAIILSAPYSPFISRWLDSYADFDRGLWATHSVSRPWELARQHPNEVTVLNKRAFFWPLWHDEHMNMVHRSIDYDFEKSGQFAYHAWEALAWGWLAQLDPDTIWIYGRKEEGDLGETSLTKLARKWVPQNLRNEWRSARDAGLV